MIVKNVVQCKSTISRELWFSGLSRQHFFAKLRFKPRRNRRFIFTDSAEIVYVSATGEVAAGYPPTRPVDIRLSADLCLSLKFCLVV